MLVCKKIRLKLKKADISALNEMSRWARWHYNYILAERIDHYKEHKKTLNLYEHKKQLKEIRQNYPEINYVHKAILHNNYFRLNTSFQNFFRRLKTGEKPGFPRFKSRYRGWFSLNFNNYAGIDIEQQTITVPTGGRGKTKQFQNITAKLQEAIPESSGQITITSDGKNFFAVFMVEIQEAQKIKNDKIIAMDLGVKTLVTAINNDNQLIITKAWGGRRYFQKTTDNLKSKRDKCNKGSNNWARNQKVVQKIIRKGINKRTDYLHKVAYYYTAKRVERTVVVGDLKVREMRSVSKRLNRAVQNDWVVADFSRMLEYKSKKFGKDFFKINERGTSKTCSQCGFQQQMPLSVRTYKCPNCLMVKDRDENSAINILHRFIARSEPQETVSMRAIAA